MAWSLSGVYKVLGTHGGHKDKGGARSNTLSVICFPHTNTQRYSSGEKKQEWCDRHMNEIYAANSKADQRRNERRTSNRDIRNKGCDCFCSMTIAVLVWPNFWPIDYFPKELLGKVGRQSTSFMFPLPHIFPTSTWISSSQKYNSLSTKLKLSASVLRVQVVSDVLFLKWCIMINWPTSHNFKGSYPNA